MRNHPGRLLLILGALCLQMPAAHAYTCSLSSPGWSAIYDPNSATANTSSSSVTVTCTRQAGDGKNLNFTVAANNGLNPSGTVNQARSSGSSLIRYNNYTDSAYSLVWGTGGSTLSGALSFTGLGTSSTTITFYAQIPALQTTASAGTYSDTVTIALYNGATPLATGNHPVTITVNPYCAFSTPPGNITFNYTSFQTTAATASASFATLCTSALPYTMSLDTTSGTLLGLTYTLSVPAGTYTGTGTVQGYVINGTIAAGQAGTCTTATCSGTDTHTLTISY